jgi:hypothetical protein
LAFFSTSIKNDTCLLLLLGVRACWLPSHPTRVPFDKYLLAFVNTCGPHFPPSHGPFFSQGNFESLLYKHKRLLPSTAPRSRRKTESRKYLS